MIKYLTTCDKNQMFAMQISCQEKTFQEANASQPEVTSLSYTHASLGLFCADHVGRAALTCCAEVLPASSDGVRAPPTSAMQEKNAS